jgi:hypothetical protein
MKNQKNVIVSEVSVVVAKKLGRPVNPNSTANLRKLALEAKRATGELKKGRPVVEGSKRQLSLANKGNGTPGRPVNTESARQIRISMLNAKREAGVLKLGRPKQVKAEVVTEVVIGEILEAEVTVEAVEMV